MSRLDWRTRALLIGGAVGALFGLTAARLYVKSVEESGETPELNPAEAVAIGLAVLGVLRRIASLPEGKRKS